MKNAVSALITQGDSILIQYHNKHKMLSVPVGLVENGESAHDAIHREIKEELGVGKIELVQKWEFVHHDIDVKEYMFEVKLLENWCNAEPHKHEWMEFRKIEDLLKDNTPKTNALIGALAICNNR